MFSLALISVIQKCFQVNWSTGHYSENFWIIKINALLNTNNAFRPFCRNSNNIVDLQ